MLLLSAPLEEARAALNRASAAFYERALPPCENRLTALLGQVVAEYDDFEAAFARLRMDYGTSFRGESPKAAHVRLFQFDGDCMGRRRWLTFSPATMPAVPVEVPCTPVEIPPTVEVVQSVKGESAKALEYAQDAPAAEPERNPGRYVLTGMTTPMAPAPVAVEPDAERKSDGQDDNIAPA